MRAEIAVLQNGTLNYIDCPGLWSCKFPQLSENHSGRKDRRRSVISRLSRTCQGTWIGRISNHSI